MGLLTKSPSDAGDIDMVELSKATGKRHCGILEVGVTSHVQIRHIVLGCLVSFSLFIMFNLCACNVCENRRTITKI